MAQATPSISRHTPLTIAQHIAMATMTRAMQVARDAVKEELKKQKIRLADVEARDITSWALVYLEDHPAPLMRQGWRSRGGLPVAYSPSGHNAPSVQNLKVMHKRRRLDPQGL